MGRGPALRHAAGERFGRLVVVGYDRKGSWHVRCDCGAQKAVTGTALRSGATTSCGCLASELKKSRATTHGQSIGNGTPEYRTWSGIIDRCENPNATHYRHYGGRGIAVCARWRVSFENFLADMGHRPITDGPSKRSRWEIERKDNDKGYEPGNCIWATRITQINNTRRNVFVEHDGRRLTIAQWAREVGIGPGTIRHRLDAGWPSDRALTTPTGRAA
jgi:hypothetical protein